MSDHYMAVAYLVKCEGEYNWDDQEFASTIPNLDDMAWLEADLWDALRDNEQQIKELPDGEYRITVWGETWFDSDRDWETDTENGSFMFDWKNETLRILKQEIPHGNLP